MKRMIEASAATALLLSCLTPGIAAAKPIAFAHGTTVMGEYGAGTMEELQLFYAPRYFYSVGGGHLRLNSDIDGRSRDITYARFNYLETLNSAKASGEQSLRGGGAGNAKCRVQQ